MIDIGKLESRLECLNETFEKPFSVIEDAIKVIKIYGTVKHLFIGYADSNIKYIEEKYFPKPKTRRERLTNIIQKVYNSYVSRDISYNKERDSIICELVNIRDEEENE